MALTAAHPRLHLLSYIFTRYIHISIEYIYMFIKVEMIMVNRVIIARAMVQPTR